MTMSQTKGTSTIRKDAKLDSSAKVELCKQYMEDYKNNYESAMR